MRDRRKKLDFWWGYYTGEDQRLPIGPKGASRAYQDFQKKARTNLCATPVDAVVHRTVAIGLTDGDGNALKEPWKDWWQRNRLDARQRQVYRTALALSESYVSVGPHPKDSKRPLIVPEHPRQVIVEEDPATGERVAAVKAWYDSIDRVARATVFLPDRIVNYVTDRRPATVQLPWGESSWTVVPPKSGGDSNPLGVVPIVPFACRPDLAEDPEPEFARIIDIQDRINLGVLNRMTAERYSAFRQKYATGAKMKKEIDPATGLEIAINPYVPDPGALWIHESEKANFGEFSQTDLLGYLKVFQSDVQTAFVITSTPAYYFPDGLINVATDTVMALDTNHVAKVQEHEDNFGEAWEEVFVLAGMVAGSEVDFTASEIRWKDPRQLNPAVVADMGVKKKSMGYPLTMVAEDMGDSPQRVERLRSEAAAEQFRNSLTQLPQTTQPPQPRQEVPPPVSESA